MECSWCSKKDYFVMKIPCNHHICVLCYKNQMSCNICKKQIIQNIQKKQTTEIHMCHGMTQCMIMIMELFNYLYLISAFFLVLFFTLKII